MIAAIKDQGFSELVTTETFTGLTVLMKGKSMKLFFFLSDVIFIYHDWERWHYKWANRAGKSAKVTLIDSVCKVTITLKHISKQGSGLDRNEVDISTH